MYYMYVTNFKVHMSSISAKHEFKLLLTQVSIGTCETELVVRVHRFSLPRNGFI